MLSIRKGRLLLRTRALVCCLLILVAAIAGPIAWQVATFPEVIRLLPGQSTHISLSEAVRLVDEANPGALSRAGDDGYSLAAAAVGRDRLELYVLGIPLRTAQFDVVPEVDVIPGGQSVGVLVSYGGLLVVKTVPVIDATGDRMSPAEAAGVRPGDVIESVGGQPISHPLQFEHLVAAYGTAGRPVPLRWRRGDEQMTAEVPPSWGRTPLSDAPGPGPERFQLGLVLEDPAAGVGTLTFWDPKTGIYGALGHMITSRGGQSALPFHDGRIVNALIRGIQPGQRGRPGEKLGVFDATGGELGSIAQNTDLGIFGRLFETPPQGLVTQAVPVALANEVKVGPAVMLTVLNRDRVEAFRVEIEAVTPQLGPQAKGLVVRVTDPRLLSVTGGIVQGMSGSPLLQNGRFIGAVTHVFVNDPTRGYGVMAEWMLDQAGLWSADRPLQKAS